MASDSPIKTAITLLKAWIHSRDVEDCLPIDAKKLAEGLGIKVRAENIDDKFDGMLSIKPVKAIIYNASIPSTGRQNFTISHELGHYCLHSTDSKCSFDDIILND